MQKVVQSYSHYSLHILQAGKRCRNVNETLHYSSTYSSKEMVHQQAQHCKGDGLSEAENPRSGLYILLENVYANLST